MKRLIPVLALLAALLPVGARGQETTVVVSGSVSGDNNTLKSGGAANDNFGGEPVIQVGSDDLGEDMQVILRIDLSSLTGSSILSGSLQLTLASTEGTFSNEIVYLYEISAANAGWAGGNSTGYHLSGASDWYLLENPDLPWASEASGQSLTGGLVVAGVDYVETPVGTISVNSSDVAGTTYTINLTDTGDMTNWANNPATNSGFVLIAPDLEGGTGTNISFDSDSAAAGAPTLMATAVPEPGTGMALWMGVAGIGWWTRYKARGQREI